MDKWIKRYDFYKFAQKSGILINSWDFYKSAGLTGLADWVLTEQPRGAFLLDDTVSVRKKIKWSRWIEIQRTTLDPSVSGGVRSPEHGGDGGDTVASAFPAFYSGRGRTRPT